DVDREDVAVLERVTVGDAVDDHRVRRGADRGGIAAVALEGGSAALRADELLGERVEVGRRDSGPDVFAHQLETARDHLAGARHRVDLGCGLPDDHSAADSVACSIAAWISANTSPSVRSP